MNRLIKLLLIVSLLTFLSCTYERITVTGAERLYGKNKVNDTRFGKIPLIVGFDLAQSVTDTDRDPKVYFVLRLGF